MLADVTVGLCRVAAAITGTLTSSHDVAVMVGGKMLAEVEDGERIRVDDR